MSLGLSEQLSFKISLVHQSEGFRSRDYLKVVLSGRDPILRSSYSLHQTQATLGESRHFLNFEGGCQGVTWVTGVIAATGVFGVLREVVFHCEMIEFGNGGVQESSGRMRRQGTRFVESDQSPICASCSTNTTTVSAMSM